VLFFFIKDNPFFWDTIHLASKQAHWYFENNFQYFFLPEELDSGHPPGFSIVLATLWVLFGKSLWVGHAMIMVFSIGIVFLLHHLGRFFLGEKATVFLLLLTTVDPFIAGQSTLVSPDVLVLFFWLLGLWAVVKNKNYLLIFAGLCLACMSMRGMMLVVVLFLFNLVWIYLNDRMEWKSTALVKRVLPYVPAGLLGLAFLAGHYEHTGWIGYHEDSSWAPAFEKVDFKGFVKNVAVLGWRMLDFGRVFLWLVLGFVVLRWRRSWQLDAKGKALIALLLICSVILLPSLLMHAHLLAHRYLLPLILVLNFIFIYLIFSQKTPYSASRYLFAIVFIGMFTGNFWVYPRKISQGWDSTLGHLSYFPLRREMIQFIDQQAIPLETIGTAFPENVIIRYLDLSDRADGFGSQAEGAFEYVLYSNVMNDFSDESIDALDSNFKIVKRFDRLGVCLILYKKKPGK